MNTSTLETQKNMALAEKTKFITNTINDETSEKSIWDKVDEMYASTDDSTSLAKFLRDFNEKALKERKLSYNPANTERFKTVNGCTECRYFTDIVSEFCTSYGCVQEFFTISAGSDNCNSFIYQKRNLITRRAKATAFGAKGFTKIRSGAENATSCGSQSLLKLALEEEILIEAMCQCSNLNAVQIALEDLNTAYDLAIDSMILYGEFDDTITANATNSTPFFQAVQAGAFDSIDLLIGNSQKMVASDIKEVYKKTISAMAQLMGKKVRCNTADVNILMHPLVKMSFFNFDDNNDRLQFTELGLAGIDCANLRIACANTHNCHSVYYKENMGTGANAGNVVSVTTDIWVGVREYALGKHLVPMVNPYMDRKDGVLLVQGIRYIGGKLLMPEAYYRIRATIAL
jgi:hypothetical protein